MKTTTTIPKVKISRFLLTVICFICCTQFAFPFEVDSDVSYIISDNIVFARYYKKDYDNQPHGLGNYDLNFTYKVVDNTIDPLQRVHLSIKDAHLSNISQHDELYLNSPEGRIENPYYTEWPVYNYYRKHLYLSHKIGTYAFAYCEGLESVEIPNYYEILPSAFTHCINLKDVVFNDEIGLIDEHAFEYTGLERLKIVGADEYWNDGRPYYTLRINDYAFSHCRHLKEVDLGGNYTILGDNVFEYCDSIPEIVLKGKATSIGNRAFQHCTSLKSVKLGSMVKTLGNECFSHCIYLSKFPQPDSVGNILNLESIGARCFAECDSLVEITLPVKLSVMGSGAFQHCKNLRSVKVDDRLTGVSTGCFEGCTALEGFAGGTNIRKVSDNAFRGCESLDSISFAQGLTEIGADAFSGCKRLRSATLPSSLGYIAPSAFRECELSEIVWKGMNFPASEEDLFSEITYENATLYVAPGGKQNAETTYPWSKFRHIVEVEMAAVEETKDETEQVSGTEVYNLSGWKIADSINGLAPGLYIVRQNGMTNKLIIK